MKIIKGLTKSSLKLFLIFILSLIWLNFFNKKQTIENILLSCVITLFLGIITYSITKKKNQKHFLKLSEQTDAENMYLSLLIEGNETDFFYNLLSTRHKNIKKNKKFIVLTNQKSEEIIIYPLFKFDKISTDDINKIIKKKFNADKILIICGDFDEKCNNQIKLYEKKIMLLNKYETYKLLYKEYDFYPEIKNKNIPTKKQELKHLLSLALDKKNIKGYIVAIIVLFISSFYVINKIYYYVIISSLIFLSLFICFNRGEKHPNENIF